MSFLTALHVFDTIFYSGLTILAGTVLVIFSLFIDRFRKKVVIHKDHLAMPYQRVRFNTII